MDENNELEKPKNTQKWPILKISLWLVLIAFLQLIFVPCMCAKGQVKIMMAFSLDALFIIRVVIAYVIKEEGRAWIGYLIVLASTIIVIPLLFG